MTATITTPEQLRDLYLADVREEDRFTFSDQQFAAITAPLEPAVVLAGAGSGKTEVMAARVFYLVATGQVAPGKVLGLTFTKKAASELGKRIRGALQAAGPRAAAAADDDGGPVVSTYHSYAASLLTTHGLRLGHEPDTRLVTDGMRFQLAARAVRRHTRPVQHLGDYLPHLVRDLLALDAELSEHLVEPDAVREYDAEQRRLFEAGIAAWSARRQPKEAHDAISAIDRRGELLGLVEEYRALKARLGLMDFSDQISRAARLALEFPEVGAAEREAYAVVMLDEYQDTSVSQALLLSRLFSGATAADGFGHPVTAVGDPNQAIYGWRGASVSNILEFARFFPRPDAREQIYHLTVNRRSDRRILTTANRLAGDLYAARPEVLPLEPMDGVAEGRVEVCVHDTYDEELAWLSSRVVQAHDELLASGREEAWKQIGVLVRDNEHAAAVFETLASHDIPVQIVGLTGMLRLPEVAQVVATLTLIQDVTANPALLTLLTGPRWAIGVRDLALLGRRAEELSGNNHRHQTFEDVREHLLASVTGAEPLEMASLCDALEDPGDLDYSPEARERFALLADELRRLRAAAGEPLLDLVRRIIDTTGIDLELASSLSPAAAARRNNLDQFVQAVTEFQAVDGKVSLPALVAWLQAEEEYAKGLEAAMPSDEDSVKVLTVYAAKGLEWDAVFLVGVQLDKFPRKDLRPSWLTSPAVLPTALRGDADDLEQLSAHSADDIVALKARAARRQALEELRVAYVAWTRARHLLSVSAWCWQRGRKTPLGPSPYVRTTRDIIATWGAEPERWLEPPEKTDPHPHADDPVDVPWPGSHPRAEEEVARRREAASRVAAVDPDAPDDLTGLDPAQRDLVASWDTELERLLDEATRERATRVDVPLPSSLSATWLARLRDDPEGLARDLARPMPRPPAPAARFGTRFHAWVEARFGQQQLLDPDELPGRADTGIEDDADLQELIERFEAGPFADRAPYAIEPAFALLLAGQPVRGRIDAVYAEQVDGQPGFLIVDWKTNQKATADPLQLAIYRVAWAELQGIPVERVRAQFYYVRSGEIVAPAGLPERAALEAIVTGLADTGLTDAGLATAD